MRLVACCSLDPLCFVGVARYGIKLNGSWLALQILNGGAPCQQIDSEEEDEQEAEAEDEVSTRDTLHALSQHVALLLLCCAVMCCAVLCCHIICPNFNRGFALQSCCQSQDLLYTTLYLFKLGR